MAGSKPANVATTVSTVADARRRFFRRGNATGEILTWLASQPRGRLLELPAGEGVTVQQIQALGFEVTPADLFPDYYKYPSPKCVKADMRKRLPFADCTFDYMLCQEGIEHIESPLSFTLECQRVLKPGGRLILTTPNVLHMTGRLAYLLVGQRTWHRGYINDVQTLLGRDGDDFNHGHAWHWRYTLLRYILKLSGFRVPMPRCTKYSVSSILLSIPMFPLLLLGNWWAIRNGLANEQRRELVPAARAELHEIRSHLLSRALLWGTRLVVIAEKPA
jgi:2-polyprenyl-3-methyl-5-hydroxy-6-metoxy-1,4-benzoquinol methylase